MRGTFWKPSSTLTGLAPLSWRLLPSFTIFHRPCVIFPYFPEDCCCSWMRGRGCVSPRSSSGQCKLADYVMEMIFRWSIDEIFLYIYIYMYNLTVAFKVKNMTVHFRDMAITLKNVGLRMISRASHSTWISDQKPGPPAAAPPHLSPSQQHKHAQQHDAFTTYSCSSLSVRPMPPCCCSVWGWSQRRRERRWWGAGEAGWRLRCGVAAAADADDDADAGKQRCTAGDRSGCLAAGFLPAGSPTP